MELNSETDHHARMINRAHICLEKHLARGQILKLNGIISQQRAIRSSVLPFIGAVCPLIWRNRIHDL
jgi:hypothetical protein